MFTGIIQHLGTVEQLRRNPGGARLFIAAGELAAGLSQGASVCVNGVCLTVVRTHPPGIEFDVIAESLRRSTLGLLNAGDSVNLEPSLRVSDTLDGHFVQGHVDGTAKLIRSRRVGTGGEDVLWFEPESEIHKYLIPKGSVAIDGVSLTIADLTDAAFSVALIPTTLELTTLGARRVGDRVNIETDILARTVIHHLESMRSTGRLTVETLEAHGFA